MSDVFMQFIEMDAILARRSALCAVHESSTGYQAFLPAVVEWAVRSTRTETRNLALVKVWPSGDFVALEIMETQRCCSWQRSVFNMGSARGYCGFASPLYLTLKQLETSLLGECRQRLTRLVYLLGGETSYGAPTCLTCAGPTRCVVPG